MTRHRLAVISLLAVWMIALAFVVKAALDRLTVPSWGNPPGGDLSALAVGDTAVGERFTAPLPGLYRIQVALVPATTGTSRSVTFHLKTDAAAATDLWTTSFWTDDVQEGVPMAFEFPPRRDSQGQTFYFYLESPGPAPGQGLAARYGPATVLEGANACLNHQPLAGNLVFDTFYTLRTRDRAGLLLSRMADGRPYLFGSRGFYVGLALAYALVLGLFLLYIARAIE